MMYLGIDYGRKRIGLAVGSVLPRGIGTIDFTDKEKVFSKIKEICEQYEVEKIVIGLPLRSDNGQESEMSLEIREFARDLSDFLKIEVLFEEEQYTSEEAKRLAREYSADLQSVSIDEISAILILEQYLGGEKGVDQT